MTVKAYGKCLVLIKGSEKHYLINCFTGELKPLFLMFSEENVNNTITAINTTTTTSIITITISITTTFKSGSF